MKPLSLLLFAFLASATTSKAKSFIKYSYALTDTTYSEENVDKKPEPVKGMEDIYKKIAKTFRYPASAREKGVKGKILLYLTISSNGKISNVEIKEGLTPDVNNEALRSLRSIKTSWYPGIKNNQKVNTRVIFPLSLNLEAQ